MPTLPHHCPGCGAYTSFAGAPCSLCGTWVPEAPDDARLGPSYRAILAAALVVAILLIVLG